MSYVNADEVLPEDLVREIWISFLKNRSYIEI